MDLTPMIVREVDIVTTVAHVCDSDIPTALQLLAESNIAAVTAGPRMRSTRSWKKGYARSPNTGRPARSS